MKTSLCLLIIWFVSLPLCAQQGAAISGAERVRVVEKVAALLDSNYVFPEKAQVMGNYIRKQLKAKAYDELNTYQKLASAISKDLQAAHRDPHMHLQYNPEFVSKLRKWKATAAPGPELLQEQLLQAERENFGFVKVERLAGNIGYVDFRFFFPISEQSKQTVAAAMTFVANTDAVILDLRNNGGGHPEMVQLVMSYFFDGKPIHYNSIYDRLRDTTKDYYTLEQVDGERMPETDLYVLTSSYTFSGAEELTYNLKSLKRATIVGETTGGGAHPVQPSVVNDQLVLHIPFARAINAITKTNWEGTGITPDVPIAAGKALAKAQQMALNKRLAGNISSQEKALLEWELLQVESQLNPIQLEKKAQARYTGRYGDRSVQLQEDKLYYQPKGFPEKPLIPITDVLFQVGDMRHMRVEFVRDASGRPIKLLELHENGSFQEFARTD